MGCEGKEAFMVERTPGEEMEGMEFYREALEKLRPAVKVIANK